jgi:hypothetical protein
LDSIREMRTCKFETVKGVLQLRKQPGLAIIS